MLSAMVSMFVPETILENFDIFHVQKRNENWVIELREKENRISNQLTQEAVLDGFCNSIEVMNFGFSLGPVYLKIYHRRWRQSNDNEHLVTIIILH